MTIETRDYVRPSVLETLAYVTIERPFRRMRRKLRFGTAYERATVAADLIGRTSIAIFFATLLHARGWF